MTNLERRFGEFANWFSVQVGRAGVFAATVMGTLAWLATQFTPWREGVNNFMGAWTGVASIWLLVILQNSTTRGQLATNLKFSEVIKAIPGARDEVALADELTEEELLERRDGETARLRHAG